MIALRNVKLLGKPGMFSVATVQGKIGAISCADAQPAGQQLDIYFENALLIPGLINSHDHLDFNLFPPMGTRYYQNYTEWAADIHAAFKTEIDAIVNIPRELRARWGMFKNLLCGVTTVVNHGEKLPFTNPLINIISGGQNLHSIHLQPKWRLKLNDLRKKNLPVIIHIGEGLDELAKQEIDRLVKWNLLRRELIGVHAVAMTAGQARHFKALVWCPQSNYFLLNKTADLHALKQHSRLLFGTDSTLTGHWDFWDHAQIARKTRLLNDHELYDSMSTSPAGTWGLNCGVIKPGKDADLVVARTPSGDNSFDDLYAVMPQDILLVMHRGMIRLFDECIYSQLSATDLSSFNKISIGGICKYIQGDLPSLMTEIRNYHAGIKFPVHAA